MKRLCNVSNLKAHFLQWVKQVHDDSIEVVITKRKTPYARLVPIKKRKCFGRMEGTGHIIGDIIAPIDEEWDACSQ